MSYEQYQTLKRAQPDLVLLLKVGDVYHAFDGDAQTVAAVTKRACHSVPVGEQRVDTCCVLHALVEATVEQLVQAGYKVGLAEPVKEAARGQVVQRVTAGERWTDAVKS